MELFSAGWGKCAHIKKMSFLRQHNVKSLKDWLAQTLDLSTIENLLSIPKKNTYDRKPIILEELQKFTEEQFHFISNTFISKLQYMEAWKKKWIKIDLEASSYFVKKSLFFISHIRWRIWIKNFLLYSLILFSFLVISVIEYH